MTNDKNETAPAEAPQDENQLIAERRGKHIVDRGEEKLGRNLACR